MASCDFLGQGLKSQVQYFTQHATGTPRSAGAAQNDLWGAGYKGEFRRNHTYCYPLTVTGQEQKTLQPLDNPFGPGLSPMS